MSGRQLPGNKRRLGKAVGCPGRCDGRSSRSYLRGRGPLVCEGKQFIDFGASLSVQ